MASGVDLGKQVGPLPLGAWVAVVGAGLGVALYTRRQSQGAGEPTIVEDTSGVPGVGTGVNGMWTDVTPVPPSNAPTTYTDNDSWGRAAIDRLIADGYQPAQVYSAITKALAGGQGDNALSVSEYAIWARALVLLKAPPIPVGVSAPSPTGPPGTTPPPTGGGSGTPALKYVVQTHQIAAAESARGLIKRFSSTRASATQIEVALRRTMADPRNARYLAYYASHRGMFPAQAKVYTTVVV
jgi:hypothetical protein